LIILTLGAAESSIGLALLVIFYKTKGGISVDMINHLKS